ncbi:MAG: flagellar basal body P-ring formation chaperone FlgA [Pseudomonadota bacterium]
MRHAIPSRPTDKSEWQGYLGYLTVLLWFLLTVLTPLNAQASEGGSGQHVISPLDLLPDIEAALMDEGLPAAAEISFNNDTTSILVSENGSRIETVSFNPRSGRFVIRLSDATPNAIAGMARIRAALPVLRRQAARGQIINETDLDFLEIAIAPGERVLQNENEIIGMEARRTLAANEALRRSDLRAPVLISKGDLVTLTYKTEGIRLSHQGVAMDSGGRGDVIAVRNVQSERILRGIVADGKRVQVVTMASAYEMERE